MTREIRIAMLELVEIAAVDISGYIQKRVRESAGREDAKFTMECDPFGGGNLIVRIHEEETGDVGTEGKSVEEEDLRNR